MSTDSVYFDDYLNEQLKDPEFKAEYDALEAEDAIIRARIEAEIQSGLTYDQLSEKTGIAQSELRELENGGSNFTLSTLQRFAAGIGMKLRLEFQPV